MLTIRHILETLLNPFFLFLLIFAILLIFLWRRGKQPLVQLGFLFLFIFILIISTSWLPKIITHQLEGPSKIVNKADPAIHWVVVLSGGQANVKDVPANALLYSASLKRLVEGVRLYRQLPNAKLILSGGGYQQETAEAIHLAEVASWFNLPQKDIIVEDRSVHTAGQAEAVKKIVGQEPFYLVTSAIHMPRSILLFKGQGLHPIAAPTDYTYFWNDERWEKSYFPNSHNLFYLTIAMHEILGITWAKMTNFF